MNYHQDPHFKNFVGSLRSIITAHGDDNTTARQKEQVEGLIRLETEFRRELIRQPWGKNVYKAFIKYIVEERRNILEARPFFRERNFVFTGYNDPNNETKYIKGISDFLRERSHRGLYRFRFNYQFIAFVMEVRKRRTAKLNKLYKEILSTRNELIEMNLPLAISQAKMFWGKMQKIHISQMDFIQIASEGLIAAIDKFCPPYTTVFRTVAAHRMKGNFIENFSETVMHFYPKDKRRLYQAHKYIKQQQGKEIDYKKMVRAINKRLKPIERTNVSEVMALLNSSSVVPASTIPEEIVDDDKPISVLDKFAAPMDERPDIRFEDAEAHHALREAISQLTVFEKKFLKLKGLEL